MSRRVEWQRQKEILWWRKGSYSFQLKWMLYSPTTVHNFLDTHMCFRQCFMEMDLQKLRKNSFFKLELRCRHVRLGLDWCKGVHWEDGRLKCKNAQLMLRWICVVEVHTEVAINCGIVISRDWSVDSRASDDWSSDCNEIQEEVHVAMEMELQICAVVNSRGLSRTLVDCGGLFWIVVDSCGLLCTFVNCCSLLRTVENCCGLLLISVDCCGLLWTVVDCCRI